jgi:hypothetical protein
MDHKVLFLSLPRGPQPQFVIIRRRSRRAVNGYVTARNVRARVRYHNVSWRAYP